MSTISGAWKFKDVLTRPTVDFNESVSFEFALHYLFGGVTYNAIGKGKSIYTARAASGATLWALNYAYDINFIDLPGSGDTPSSAEKGVYSNREDQWLNDGEGEYQIIDFGTVPQDVSAEFYEWFRKNARPVFAHIRYNGGKLTDLFEGQTATLKCEGMKMDSDVVVEVAEQSGEGEDLNEVLTEQEELINTLQTTLRGKAGCGLDSALPKEVQSESEMLALLTTGTVGEVYKYLGDTTAVYEHGALYVLESDD